MNIRQALSITLVLFLCHLKPVVADEAYNALKYSDQRKWEKAISSAKRAKDPVLKKFIKARKYQDIKHENSFFEAVSFIESNPYWPELDKIKSAAENYIDYKVSKKYIIRYFRKNPPRTQSAYKNYGLALTEVFESDKRDKGLIRDCWVYGEFSENEAEFYTKHNKGILRHIDHIKKADILLYAGKITEARKLLSPMDKKTKTFFDAHVAFINHKSNRNRLYNRVHTDYKNSSRLLYRYLIQHRKDDRVPKSVATMSMNAPCDKLFEKEWWRIKNLFARNMLERRRYNLAYKITSSHQPGNCGIDNSNAEFLSGWVAHAYLKKPDIASQHFERMYKIVSKPISLAKAAYWTGIAYKSQGKKDESKLWLEKAAKFNFIFYGQLAMLELGIDRISFPPSSVVTREDRVNYSQNEFARASRILLKHRRVNDSFEFAKVAVSKSKSPGEVSLIIDDMKKSKNKFHIWVLAKMAAYKNFMLVADNYQTPFKIPKNNKVELALTYAIIMKESGFDHKAISHANAHGLMQMIPQTGCDMQKSLNMKCSVRRLTSDPNHNIILGNKYLSDLLDSYNGSYILTFATYNAGPEPVKKWIRKNGDPRKFKTKDQVIHWIETVPYYETRDYIKRVLEYLQVYREVLYQKSRLELEKDLFRGRR